MGKFNVKKAISPVVATALLLVVAVVAVVGFASWFDTFKSNLFVDIEQQGSISNLNVGVEALVGDILYFRSADGTQISSVTIDGIECSGLNGTYPLGIQSLNVSACLGSVTSSTPEIVVVTNSGVLSKTVFISGNGGSTPSFSSCELDGITRVHGESYNFFNSTSVPFGSSCSSEERTCNDGTFDGDTSFNLSSCLVDGQDTMPDAFSFTNQNNVALGVEIISNTIIPSGFDGPLSVNITGDGNPELSINSGSWVTSGSMNPSDNLTIRLTSAIMGETLRQATLTLGDYNIVWNVTTMSVIPSLSCSTDSDSNGFIAAACANYPMTITTLEGHLDPDDSNSLVIPRVECVWNNDRSACESYFEVDGCGSGTVLDTSTGLCWQRNFGTAGQRTWTNAISYCDGLTHGGHSDWYLPSRQEFETIVDLTRTAPHIVGGNNNIFENVVSSWYWTKTTYGVTTTAFHVILSTGLSTFSAKDNAHDVACVRRH